MDAKDVLDKLEEYSTQHYIALIADENARSDEEHEYYGRVMEKSKINYLILRENFITIYRKEIETLEARLRLQKLLDEMSSIRQ